MIFTANKDGFYYNNMSNTEGVSSISIMEENRKHYTQPQYEHANIARKRYPIVGHPSIKDYNNIIRMNEMKKNPVKMDDIDICEKIFGPFMYTLKGKTVCTKPKAVVNDYIDIIQELKDTHQQIELCDNFMYILGQMFLVTISKKIKLITFQYIQDSKIPILNKAFDNTFRVYNQEGFQIKTVGT